MQLHKNTSLVESLKKDPLGFVQAFQQVDPTQIHEIIDLLKIIKEDSKQQEQLLISAVAHADEVLRNAIEALEQAQRAHDEAVGAKAEADLNLGTQQPILINEQSVIEDVINQLLDLTDCPSGWEIVDDSYCYKIIGDSKSYEEALTECEALGGYLPEIDDEAEFNAVASFVNTDQVYWLGGSDAAVEGQFVFGHSGKAVDFLQWCSSQPDNAQNNENCLDLRIKSGNWCYNDIPCESEHRYSGFCER